MVKAAAKGLGNTFTSGTPNGIFLSRRLQAAPVTAQGRVGAPRGISPQGICKQRWYREIFSPSIPADGVEGRFFMPLAGETIKGDWNP